MPTWYKCPHSRVALGCRMVSGFVALILTIILLAPNALPRSGSCKLIMPAVDFTRKVVTNKLRVRKDEQSPLDVPARKGGVRKETDSENPRDEEMDLSVRLLSIDGRPLTPRDSSKRDRARTEAHQPSGCSRNYGRSRTKQEQQRKDAYVWRHCLTYFVYHLPQSSRRILVDNSGSHPTPTFRPPSLEARVFHHMEGEMTVDAERGKLVRAQSPYRMADVKFGGQLSGAPEQEEHVRGLRQTEEVVPGHWESTALHVNMEGEELYYFETIEVSSDREPRRLPSSAGSPDASGSGGRSQPAG